MSTMIESVAPQTMELPRTSWQGVEMSVEEFLALPDDGIHRELIHGRVRELGMTTRNRFHSRIEANAAYHLVGWLRKQPSLAARSSVAKPVFDSGGPMTLSWGLMSQ